jgi:diadenosine tetraphosphate (Ap4A) HIT family hydrolase
MTDFAVDPVILSLTHHVVDWPLSRVFLYDDARYFWCMLVPRRAGVIEMADLAPEDQAQLMQEIVRLSAGVRGRAGVEKLNVGALGNMVPQLHVHVLGRAKGDPSWPGPVWGHSEPRRHDAAERDARLALVRSF